MGLSNRVKLRIKEIIEQKHISIYELALKSELTEACIRNWYTKRDYTPSLKAIEKIADALNVPVSAIIKDDESEIISVDREQKKLLENWVLLEEKQKRLVMFQIDTFLNN